MGLVEGADDDDDYEDDGGGGGGGGGGEEKARFRIGNVQFLKVNDASDICGASVLCE